MSLSLWVKDVLQTVIFQLEDVGTFAGCDELSLKQLNSIAEQMVMGVSDNATNNKLNKLLHTAHKYMATGGSNVNLAWRRFYTEACILRGLADLQLLGINSEKKLALDAIGWFDHAIVIAGAPGEGRLDLIYDIIKRVQVECLPARSYSTTHSYIANNIPPPRPESASLDIPRYDAGPPFSAFIKTFSQRPFIITGFVQDWPAFNERPWRSVEYLRYVAGPGRIVPVEVGNDYRDEDWTQRMMPWDDFLDALDLDANPQRTEDHSRLYLAQHDLLKQFPELREDIVVPDYVYASLSPPTAFPDYIPPQNEDQLVVNAWFGPGGTVSPAHTDPFYNFYAQVVGRKIIWLAPPTLTTPMYPYPPASRDNSQPHNPAANNTSPSMSNTSQVDVFKFPEEGQASRYPLFQEQVVPHAMSAVLEPGDLLFIPVGWWHAMRSEETSFSVSMWF